MMGVDVKKDTGVKKTKSYEVIIMDVKLLEQKRNITKLLFKGTDAHFMNTLRRKIMAGTPILAVEDVHFYENNSVMFDEMLASRLGLIPLKMDSKNYKRGDKVKLVLEKEGPCTVYSKDIKSTDPKIEPAELNVPITILSEGQKIKIEMDAIVGIGKDHVKHQPAIISYQEIPIVNGKSYQADVIEKLLDEKQRDFIVDKNEKIEYDPTAFIFTVESHGNLNAKELFMEAVNELKEKTKEFKGELKNLS